MPVAVDRRVALPCGCQRGYDNAIPRASSAPIPIAASAARTGAPGRTACCSRAKRVHAIAHATPAPNSGRPIEKIPATPAVKKPPVAAPSSTSLAVGDSADANVLFVKTPDHNSVKNRLHLDLMPTDQEEEVERIIGLGASRADIGQGDVGWIVLADPEDNEFCVLRPRSTENES